MTWHHIRWELAEAVKVPWYLLRDCDWENVVKSPAFARLVLVLIACAVGLALLFIGRNVEGNDDNATAVYQRYGDSWYEFRYDWRDYRDASLDWESVDELYAFLLMDDTDERLILTADADGIIFITGYCEDLAFQLRDRAEEVGKRLETEGLTRRECYQYREFVTANYNIMGNFEKHMVCKAIIGNEVWYVEPDNDKQWLDGYLH